MTKEPRKKKLIEGTNQKKYIWKLELKYYIKNKQNFNKKKWWKSKLKRLNEETNKNKDKSSFFEVEERNDSATFK